MKHHLTLLAAALALTICTAHARPVEWVCSSTSGPGQIAQASPDLPEGTEVGAVVAKRPKTTRSKPVTTVTREALLKALKGDALWTGDDFLTIYILPARSPETIAAVRELGVILSPEDVAQTAEILARPGGLVDRYIRVVRPSEMADKINQRHPSAGVMPAGSDAQKCF